MSAIGHFDYDGARYTLTVGPYGVRVTSPDGQTVTDGHADADAARDAALDEFQAFDRLFGNADQDLLDAC